MGAIMAYGAYMPSSAPIGKTVLTVAILDTLVALVAGMAIFPIVFAHDIEASAGPGLIFVSLPLAFGNMAGGQLFGTLFFVLVSIAAWSSAISLIEPAVAWLVERKSMTRTKATLVLGALCWLLGVGSVLSFNEWAELKLFDVFTVFDFMDFITSSVMLPIGGMLIALFVGWVMIQDAVRKEVDISAGIFPIWMILLRFVAPVAVAGVFVNLLIETFGS